MKKGILTLLGILLLSFSLIVKSPKLNAASGSISVRANTSSVVVGGSVTVSVTVSSGDPLGSWEFSINYDSSKLKLTSGPTSVVEYGDGSQRSATYTYTFKSIAKGTSNVSVKAYNGYAWDESPISFSVGSARISAITQADLEASYSKNNNLSKLEVNGYTLSPEFNKDTLEYTVSVPSDIEKITISGEVEDKTAQTNGFGEFEVSEGENKFEITVTAQNGSAKKYVIKVNVEDKNPIEVTVDGKKYTVIKRAKALTAPKTFEATTVQIDGVEVPAFKSNITNYILVGLKSDDGTGGLYIYDSTYNTYTLYNELKTEGLLIYPKKAKATPDYYKLTKITINELEVEAYQYDGINDYYLLYGVNIETGEEGFYQYDMINNTITRYNDKIINELAKKNENYLMIIIVLGVETILLLLLLLISFTRRNKTKKTKVDRFEEIKQSKLNEIKQESKKKEIHEAETVTMEEKNIQKETSEKPNKPEQIEIKEIKSNKKGKKSKK